MHYDSQERCKWTAKEQQAQGTERRDSYSQSAFALKATCGECKDLPFFVNQLASFPVFDGLENLPAELVWRSAEVIVRLSAYATHAQIAGSLDLAPSVFHKVKGGDESSRFTKVVTEDLRAVCISRDSLTFIFQSWTLTAVG